MQLERICPTSNDSYDSGSIKKHEHEVMKIKLRKSLINTVLDI